MSNNRKLGQTEAQVTAAKEKAAKRPSLMRKGVLMAEERPGFIRRWVNEDFGRVESLMDIGWSPVEGRGQDISDSRIQVNTALGSVVRRVVNRSAESSAKTAILMEIPEELYREIEDARHERNQRTERALDPNSRRNRDNFGFMKKE